MGRPSPKIQRKTIPTRTAMTGWKKRANPLGKCVAITLSAGHCHVVRLAASAPICRTPLVASLSQRSARRRSCAMVPYLGVVRAGLAARALATRTANCSASFGGSEPRWYCAPNGDGGAAWLSDFSIYVPRPDLPVGNMRRQPIFPAAHNSGLCAVAQPRCAQTSDFSRYRL